MAKNQVLLKQGVTRKEAVAGGAIKPGHLIKRLSTAKVVVHAAAGGHAQKLFALEDELQGKTVDDSYAADDIVQFHVAQRGDEVQALLKASENVAIGDPLESAGDGTLQKYVSNTADFATNNVIAYCLEASNTGSVVKLKVEVA